MLHLPGHTPGSIALLEERTGTLYSGDIIYDGALIDDLPNSDVAAYRRSMQFLADLDVSVVHPGHGHSFDRTAFASWPRPTCAGRRRLRRKLRRSPLRPRWTVVRYGDVTEGAGRRSAAGTASTMPDGECN